MNYVREHDYVAFYNNEIESRKRFFYPPFCRVIQVVFRHKMQEVAVAAANHFATAMKADFERYISGPAEPVVNRIRNQYIMELLFKIPKDGQTIQQCKKMIQLQTALLHNDKRFRSVVVIADVDKM